MNPINSQKYIFFINICYFYYLKMLDYLWVLSYFALNSKLQLIKYDDYFKKEQFSNILLNFYKLYDINIKNTY
ncbi:transmembrane protein, putative (macronuclear) [Tetrahymena thermophila SB210]|uniref:Transmembrane protein, putative n=1 Tax=Tetrahymena thermophila (strain SB210) TaxID=312017 RepID=W7X3E0_TETTS|nr:transmembrane protein, putative [Tetrahymena thermophila SB210]EWS70943.1 transmembrane protein, putative [Tetrahymena thermophila SB210]|eukprot:XP_012656499.1 transmembrane protein, putative [Tetrahymena thermophila SB210]